MKMSGRSEETHGTKFRGLFWLIASVTCSCIGDFDSLNSATWVSCVRRCYNKHGCQTETRDSLGER
jgi:hypothetical protein